MARERLNKLLARAGVASRRGADTLIFDGHVQVNGQVVREPGLRADPRRDRVLVDGKPLPEEQRAYLVFHKPAQVITSLKDPEGRQTVAHFLPRDVPRVYPVGRLDWDCQGVLLLTNDGDLAHRLMHPSSGVPKVYRAKVQGIPAPEGLQRLLEGIDLEDGRTAPASEVTLLSSRAGKAWIRLVIHEGRNRQVKRMFEALCLPVLKLRRDSFAGLSVAGLPIGKLRVVTPDELGRLRELTGLPRPKGGARSAKQWRPRRGETDGPYGPFGGRPVQAKPPRLPGPPDASDAPRRRPKARRRRVVRPGRKKGS